MHSFSAVEEDLVNGTGEVYCGNESGDPERDREVQHHEARLSPVDIQEQETPEQDRQDEMEVPHHHSPSVPATMRAYPTLLKIYPEP